MKIILGTMTFGGQTTEKESYEMLDNFFADKNNTELDTAYIYDNSETVLGKYLKSRNINPLYVATKVNPFIKTCNLSPESINEQFIKTSLVNLQVNSVDLLYLHAPDYNTNLNETLATINRLYEEKKIKELGLSNFPAWMVVNIYRICEKNNWLLPTVYQGMYNAITRKVEDELFPALRELNIRFYVFNPLAGGILCGKYKYEENPTEGRFVERPLYVNRYWKKEIFEALEKINEKCKANGITMTEASIRWLLFHSALSNEHNDGIIIGASKVSQFTENMKYCNSKEKLPNDIVESFNEAWNQTKSDSAPYFRAKGYQNDIK